MEFMQWFRLIVFIARIILYISKEGNGDLPTLIEASERIDDVPTVNGKEKSSNVS